MLIDLHAHVVPERFPSAGNRASRERWPSLDHFEPGKARVMIAGKNFRTVTDQNWSAARRLEDMAAEGVDAQVLSPMPELLSYWFTPEDARDFGRYVNETIAGMVQASSGRFYGLGMVPLQDADLAAKELAEVKKTGLHGVEVGSNVGGKSLGDERFLTFFQEAEAQDVAVFVHALHPTMTDRLPGVEQLSAAVAFPTDTGLTIVSLIAGGVLDTCPRLRLAFSHGGGSFPFILPRLEGFWSGGRWNGEQPPAGESPGALRQRIPRSPTEYARRLFYDTLLFDRRAIRYLLEMVGSSQLMVGTDYPYLARERPVSKTLRSMGLSEEEFEAIAWRNGHRFLGLSEAHPRLKA